MNILRQLRGQVDVFFSSPTRVRGLFIVAIVIVLLIGAINFAINLHRPTVQNFTIDTGKGVTVMDVRKGGASDRAGMQARDLILRINGQVIRNAQQVDQIVRAAGPGQPIEYVVLRDNREVTLSVLPAAYSVNVITLLLYLSALFAIGTAAIFGLSRSHLKEARLLYATFLFWSLAIVLTPEEPSGLTVLMGSAVPLTIMLFFYSNFYFPVFRPDILKQKKLIRAFIGLAVAIAVFGPWAVQVVRLKSERALQFLMIFDGALFTLIFFGIAIFFLNRKTRPSEAKRLGRYLKWSWLCISVSYLINVLVYFVKTEWIVYCQYEYILLMFVPIAYLYTTHRFQLLEYNPVIRRSRVYFAISLLVNFLLVVLFILGIIYLPKLNLNYPGIWFTDQHLEFGFVNDLPLEKREDWKTKSIVVLTIVFVIIFWRLSALLRKYLARKFYREKYDYKKALAEFSGIVAGCLDQRHLTTEAVQKLSEIMRLKNLGIVVTNKGKLLPEQAHGFKKETWQRLRLHSDAPWLQQLSTERAPQPIEFAAQKEKTILKELGATFLTPITLNGKLLGLFVLGEKLSEDLYRVEDLELLEAAASQTAVALENVNLHKELREKERLKEELDHEHKMRLVNVKMYRKELQERERLQKDLDNAQRIQISSLPKEVPNISGLDIFAASKPATEVGGDYYDFFQYNEKEFITIVGDVSGKGTSAALYVAKAQGVLRSIYEYHRSPSELFSKLNDLLCEEMEKSYFITQLGAKFDLISRTATIVRAGHEPIIYYNSQENSVTFVKQRGLGLCLSPAKKFASELQEVMISFNAGDAFVLYSDGLIEARDELGLEFGEHLLMDTVNELAKRSARQIGQGILAAVETFISGAKQFDDLTVCAVKIK